jgi:hypothetical protein
LFGLNKSDLPRQRQAAYHFFKRCLQNYQNANAMNNQTKADRELEEIQKFCHTTVLVEMGRQAPKLPELAGLFNQVPRALFQR